MEYLSLTQVVTVQIYTVAVYVERESTAAKLKALQQQGYFHDKSVDHICTIINQPGFRRALHIKLLRDVSTSRFISEMSKDLVGILNQHVSPEARGLGWAGNAVESLLSQYLSANSLILSRQLACNVGSKMPAKRRHA